MVCGNKAAFFGFVIQNLNKSRRNTNHRRFGGHIAHFYFGFFFGLRGHLCHLRNYFPDHSGIVDRQTGRKSGPYFFQLGIGQLLFANNNIVYPQVLVLGYGFPLGTFTYGKHGNNRCHPKDDAQHGEERTEFMIHQGVQSHTHYFFELHSILFLIYNSGNRNHLLAFGNIAADNGMRIVAGMKFYGHLIKSGRFGHKYPVTSALLQQTSIRYI